MASRLAPVDPSEFDWQSYESTYHGRALVTRLQHLITTCLALQRPYARELAKAGLLRLIPLVKAQTWDIDTYTWAVSTLYGIHHDGRQWRHTEDMEVDQDDECAGGIANLGRSFAGGLPAGPPGTGDEKDGFPDEDWVERVRETVVKEYNRLDVELRGYTSNLIKESIRLTHFAFARLSLRVGNVQEALKYYTAARETSTTAQQHIDLGIAIVEACLASNVPSPLSGHIAKIEATLDRVHPPLHAARTSAQVAMSTTASDLRERQAEEVKSQATRKSVMTRVKVAKGLLALSMEDWAKAGRDLGSIIDEEGPLSGFQFEGTAISTSDIALITVFTTLASASRDRVRRVILDRAGFKESVDDEQGWVLDLVRGYVDADYAKVMILLERAEPVLLLNPFLSSHTDLLIQSIQTRAMIQYVEPFSTVRLSTMSQTFGMDNVKVLQSVEKLVGEKKLNGRIDLIDNVLVMTETDYRAEMFAKTLAVSRKSVDLGLAALLRMKLQEAGITVDPRTKDKSDTKDGNLIKDTEEIPASPVEKEDQMGSALIPHDDFILPKDQSMEEEMLV